MTEPRTPRRPRTSRDAYLIKSVVHASDGRGAFQHRGDALIKLAIDILTKKAVPPAMFVHHHVITRENVDHYYPNDALMGVSTYAGF